MANNTITMDSLKKEGSVKVTLGMTVVYPTAAKEEILSNLALAPKFNGCYATNNSTVCFVENDEIFVTPYTRSTLATLHSSGFRKEYFYVPFSNGDYPKYEQAKWYSLREKARMTYAEEFIEDCTAYCDSHHIGTLHDETLRNCLQMPTAGIKVKHLYFEDCYYPVINSTCFDCITAEKIGTYCTNNGRVVFIYRDGKTYVTKGYKILSELRDAGYKESGLFVPFSNGEEILDPVMRKHWESITK